jgi:hypothetical protein
MLSAATSTMSEDDEHHVTLDLEHGEERLVSLPPVGDVDGRPGRRLDRSHELVHLPGIVDDDLERVDLRPARKIALRLQQRHEDHGAVVLGHAHLE